MKTNNTYSLSLQRQFQSKGLDSDINQALRELKVGSMLRKSNIIKQKGYCTQTLLFFIILLPFIKRTLCSFWTSSWISRQTEAHKDTWYRFLNCERFNWRRLVNCFALKIINFTDDVPLKDKVLIADDSIAPKTGKEMELVSYHFDHKSRKSILGNQYLQLGFHNGINFYPLDMAMVTSKKRPNTNMKSMDKRTNGWKRREEALSKKTDTLIAMVQRAWNTGIDASFVLFDSWFAHDDVIHKVFDCGYGVICRLKCGRVKYEYQGDKYTLKQLWQTFVKKRTTYLPNLQVKAACINVKLPKTGDVRLLFVSDGRKEWQALLSTDLELEPSEILKYYARRWAVEVFFKDAKQLLYMGKEQSKTFDAAIASHSIVMIRYLLLVYILNKRRVVVSIGSIFTSVVDAQEPFLFAEKIWSYVKDQLLKSIKVISYKIEVDVVWNLLEIIDDIVGREMKFAPAKL
jgi:hypothetical protein